MACSIASPYPLRLVFPSIQDGEPTIARGSLPNPGPERNGLTARVTAGAIELQDHDPAIGVRSYVHAEIEPCTEQRPHSTRRNISACISDPPKGGPSLISPRLSCAGIWGTGTISTTRCATPKAKLVERQKNGGLQSIWLVSGRTRGWCGL